MLADTLALLARLDADQEAVEAAVLHAAPAREQRAAEARGDVSPAVILLLEGQRAAARVWALHAEHREDASLNRASPEGLRRLLLAMVRDLRVVPILLARQLALLRHADRLPAPERRRLAQLTRDIHAPLANRLGIWQLKWELEDLAFRQLEPETFQKIARLL
ncbi:MAG TPA: HD domain-containing protein, partial [Xanthomonadaceae bacterium]|nr:HD domain-containing protein [Xanthomonadaceae bacterium]